MVDWELSFKTINIINVQKYIYMILHGYISSLFTPFSEWTPPGHQKTFQPQKKVPDGFGRPGRIRIGRENTPFGRENTFLGRVTQKSSSSPPQKRYLPKKNVSGWFQSLSQSSDGSEVGNIAFHSEGILKLLALLMYLKTFNSSASDHKSPQGYSAYMVKMSVVLSTLGWETNLVRHYFYALIYFNGSQPLICVIASNITNTQNTNTKPYPWPFVEAQLERHLVLRFWHPCRVPWFSWCIATGKA